MDTGILRGGGGGVTLIFKLTSKRKKNSGVDPGSNLPGGGQGSGSNFQTDKQKKTLEEGGGGGGFGSRSSSREVQGPHNGLLPGGGREAEFVSPQIGLTLSFPL